MASVAECIGKLVQNGTITKVVADQALDMFKRSQAEYAQTAGPVTADAAAALEAAKKLRDRAKRNQIAIAADVKAWRTGEQRVVEDPRGYRAAIAGMVAKDTLRGSNKLAELRRSNPAHPLFTAPNADELGKEVTKKMFSLLGPEVEKFIPRVAGRAQVMQRTSNFVDELFGISTGDQVAKAMAQGFAKVTDWAVDQAKAAGKIFDTREDWRLPQPWESRRVAQFTEQQFVDKFMEHIDSGGLKLWDKDANAYALRSRYDFLLKRAYSDIKNQGGSTAPFSNEMRTFEFQPGKFGADAWKDLQSKFGVGDEIFGAAMGHLRHMGSTIALHRVFGAHPDAMFKALMRLGRDKNPGGTALAMDSENTLKLAYGVVAGKGFAVQNESFARMFSGMRAILGAASLRNLSLRIIPSDAVMTLMATRYNGMSFVDVMSHLFDGTTTKQVARHLQIASYSYRDFALNSWRQYEDEISISGLAKRVQGNIVNWTGARWWTDNGRQGFEVSYPHLLAELRSKAWDNLPDNIRTSFLSYYGFSPKDWDHIRIVAPFVAPNGAEYLDYPNIEKELSERLQMAVSEQGAYGFHQPDARTQGYAQGNAPAGTPSGELWRSIMQYKQFGLERMTTHLMRILYDGTAGARLNRAFAFLSLSILAGAVSNQAEKVVAGRNPEAMDNPGFWTRALAAGGAGGIYGDIINEALQGDRGVSDLVAQMAGPLPGLAGDVLKTGVAPLRREFFDENGKRVASGPATEAFNAAKRWTPNTWYTKLAVDRLFWEQLQQLFDPHYRESFQRSEQAATRRGGQGFWWNPGETTP